jgi:hypothetical protein
VTEYPIHPIAELFPMLPEDELQELAEDIKQRGLIHPIVLDIDGQLLDGRNRLAACRLVDVEPQFETFNGSDPGGYALSANLSRRHLTKAQQAMIVAKWRSVSEHSVRSLSEQTGLSTGRISQATTVLEHAPDLAALVSAGSKPLDEAYKVAQERKAAASSEAALLKRLDTDAPDLAEKVRTGDMPLAEARAAAHARTVEHQRIIESAQRAADNIVARFQTDVATIVGGSRLCAQTLVTAEMIAGIRKAFELLEGEL